MKKLYQDRITALRIIKQLPHGPIKDRKIDEFFKWIDWVSAGTVTVDQQDSSTIKYREVYVDDKEDKFTVSVIVIQTDKDDLIIIDADFGVDEEAYMSSNVVDS